MDFSPLKPTKQNPLHFYQSIASKDTERREFPLTMKKHLLEKQHSG